MNRREFMQCAALLIGGLGAGQAGFVLSREQQHFMAAANYIARPARYFSDAQRRTVAAISAVIIPATDTPGAVEAGVPRFIELMVQDWFNEHERGIFDRGLQALVDQSNAIHGKPFEELSNSQQVSLLEELEEVASDSAWYDLGNTQREFLSDAPFICQLKELTIWGFFTSEVGATQVLRYEAMPMKFDGSRSLAPDDSGWA